MAAHEGGWSKVVYGGMQGGFPDNYTDSSFLEDMVMNANVVRRDLWTTVLDSVGVAQHLCVVAIIASVWAYTLCHRLTAAALLTLDALLLALGLCIWLLTTLHHHRHRRHTTTTTLRHLLYFVAGLYVMTPVFHTLTTSISSDSIWACAICLLLLHLFLHDYSCCSTTSATSTSVVASVSLHASILASVLIASRLPSTPLVFATMLFSLQFFLLFPPLSCSVKRASVKLHLVLSSLLLLAALGLLLPLSVPACLLLAAALLVITLVCPLWLLRIHEYKFEINGPWDEAKLCFRIDDDDARNL
ncbi:hypothetical protein SELMODRAFT_236892 [Selaginella moellendorffii]|uniref:Phosphatidylinositol N-acetylglucosaminyltransferase subunit C n=1 Tax=Selaginella moellendorffii TaxID=88036 RepID=D8TEN4_SELML|nr:hypothetical protein SELMODRAFT_236892 [Selaginella moellendorffii]